MVEKRSSSRGDRARKPPPRSGRTRTTHEAPTVHLDNDIVAELRATARPGKGEILVKVFSEAAGAFAAEDYAEAVRLADQSKHIALRSATVRELLGLAYYRMGQWREAARELSAFRRISGTTDQNPVIADCYRALKKPEKSLELVDEMDRKKVAPPVYYEGQIVAAGALADDGKPIDGIERLLRLDLDPEVAEEHHVRAWYVLADLLERSGRFTQARRWFDAVAAVDNESTDARERAAKLGSKE
jgi:tetratricopeptide (TPR) repeat protein